eukprot:COSAG04_NODE_689_length_11142_cov_6.664041_6_plen_280_part_00
MTACTFYRNFAGFVSAFLVFSPFPMAAVVDETDFIHNDALVSPHDCYYITAPVGTFFAPHLPSEMPNHTCILQEGPEVRAGAVALTLSGNHYDGGFSSFGLITFASVLQFRVDGDGPDEPDARFQATIERCEWLDHAGIYHAGSGAFVYPPLPNKQLRLDVEWVDTTIDQIVHVATGGEWDSTYAFFFGTSATGTFERCRFQRSGNFNPAANSDGGFTLVPPPGGVIGPTIEFAGVEWAGNAAGAGPAVHVFYGNFHLLFRQCLFQCVGPALGLHLSED